MAEENVPPFSSSLAFSATDVLESKNFSQFAVISAAALAGALVAGAAVVDAGTALGEPAGAEADVGGVVVAELPELLQAEAAAMSARPSIGARMTRRAGNWNRMTRPINLGGCSCAGCHRLKVPLRLCRSLHRMVPDVLLCTHRGPT